MSERYYWRARLIKDGPWIPVATFFDGPLVDGEILDRSPRWQARIRLEESGRAILMGDSIPIEVDSIGLRNVEGITEQEYLFMRDHADYATKFRPDLPDASPKKKIDRRGPSIF